MYVNVTIFVVYTYMYRYNVTSGVYVYVCVCLCLCLCLCLRVCVYHICMYVCMYIHMICIYIMNPLGDCMGGNISKKSYKTSSNKSMFKAWCVALSQHLIPDVSRL